MSNKRKNIEEGLLPGLDSGGGYSPTKVIQPVVEEGDKLHKQPRGYLKTTAKLVSKATDEKTLFTLPEVRVDSGGNFLREVISRNTAILGNYLLQLWQQNGGEKLVINNLSPIAEIMGNTPICS